MKSFIWRSTAVAVLCFVSFVRAQIPASYPQAGDPCYASKYCNQPTSLNVPGLKLLLCLPQGNNATCPTNKNSKVFSCEYNLKASNFRCKQCSLYGGTCSKDSDCCTGVGEGDFGLYPFCQKDRVAGIQLPTGKCSPCLHTFQECLNHPTIQHCGKLNYTGSTSSCRTYGTAGGGFDYQGHNPGISDLKPSVGPDPCTPEAKFGIQSSLGKPAVVSGSSKCAFDISYLRRLGHYLDYTGYENIYFCNCPNNATVGYSCQANNSATIVANKLLYPQFENGMRCQKCGLKGQSCGSGKIPCCDYHTCTNGFCQPPTTCTLEGNHTDTTGALSPCCGGSTFKRLDKSGRCSNAKCASTLGSLCELNDDCCGLTTRCLGKSQVDLNKTCQTCIPDGSDRKCQHYTQCCGGEFTFEASTSTAKSSCISNQCQPCITSTNTTNSTQQCYDSTQCCSDDCREAYTDGPSYCEGDPVPPQSISMYSGPISSPPSEEEEEEADEDNPNGEEDAAEADYLVPNTTTTS